jgi:hypothetical protein
MEKGKNGYCAGRITQKISRWATLHCVSGKFCFLPVSLWRHPSKKFLGRDPVRNIKITKRTHLSFSQKAYASVTCNTTALFSLPKRTQFRTFVASHNSQPIPALAGGGPTRNSKPKTRNSYPPTPDLNSHPNSPITSACWPRFVLPPLTASKRIPSKSR